LAGTDDSKVAVSDRLGPLQKRLAAACMFLIAIFILWLATPRFAASVAIAAHGDTLAGLSAEPSPAIAAARERALKAYQRARGWHQNPQIAAGLGALRLASARRMAGAGDYDGARALIVQSAADDRAALAAAPLQPYVWTRLVQADLAGASDAPEAVRHLRMAVAAAPWEPDLITARIGLAFAFWGALDEATKLGLESQIRYAAKVYPMALARQSRRYRTQNDVLQILEDDADLLRRFSLAYARI
jgi:hypothetical protein